MCKLSIIVPVFNVEQYLEQCLNSILYQSFADFEVICIDDASNDHSREILEQYALQDERIKVYYNEQNSGLSITRNKGLKYARGKYIFFVDSDDFLAEGILEKIIEKADLLQVEVLSFDTKTLCEFELPDLYNGIRKNEYLGIQIGARAYVEQVYNGDYKCSVCQYLYTKKFLEENKLEFIENVYHEDEMFMFMVYMYVKKIAFVRMVGYIYRVRAKSIMTDDDKRVSRIKDLVYLYQYSFIFFEKLKNHEKEPLKIHIDYLREYIISSYRKCTIVQKLECKNFDDPVLKHVFYNIIGMREDLELELDAILYLQNQKKLYLYGAGVYAHRWISLFDEYNIDIKGIMVTRLEENQKELYGYTIYEADKLCAKLSEDILVFPAVHKNKVNEICQNLSNYSGVTIFEHESDKQKIFKEINA